MRSTSASGQKAAPWPCPCRSREEDGPAPPALRSRMTSTVHIKVTNRCNVVAFHFSHDGTHWTQHPWQMEVSGFHHNVFGEFLSLKVGIYCAGNGEVAVRKFDDKGLV
jgi:xylan 1,4-beta-xylosidase